MPIPEEPIPNECARCGGDGISEADTECPVCFGFGMLPTMGIAKKCIDIMDKLNDIKEKVDEIKEVVDAL